MDPLTHGLIIREVPVQRDCHTTLPVLLAAGCVVCGATRGELEHVTRTQLDGSLFNEPRWTNPCGHQDSIESAIAESISLVEHLLGPKVGNAFIRTLAECYIDVATEVYIPHSVNCRRTSQRADAR
jgi:hypothetical protein